MANFNKVILVGRLTRDPEEKTFASGGKVAKFGFAVTNRRKNAQSGQWEDEPMFIDVEAYNRGEGKLADTIMRFCRKGSQIMIEGRLHLDQWNDKTTNEKRSKHKLVIDIMQLLDARQDGGGPGGPPGGGMGDDDMDAPPQPRANTGYGNRGGGYGGGRPQSPPPPPARGGGPGGYSAGPDDDTDGGGGTEQDIPF